MLLMASGVTGLLTKLGHEPAPGSDWLAIACGVLAMGLQAMIARSLKLPMTHVMTGNVTQLAVDVLDYRFAGASTGASARRNAVLIAAFALGATLAGLSVPFFGSVALLMPALAMLFLCIFL